MVIRKIVNVIRMKPAVRLLIYPYVVIRTKIEISKYKKSQDAARLRELKGQYSGKRCFIIGNGPSLTIEDLMLIKDEYSFASNGIVHLFDKTEWRPNWYMVVDKVIISQMFSWNKQIFDGIESFVYDREFVEKNRDSMNVHYFTHGGKYSIFPEKQCFDKPSEDVSCYFSRSQTIATSMIELAMYLGFTDIYLLGFDHSFPIEKTSDGKCKRDNNVNHHFAGYKGKVWNVAYIDAISKAYEQISKYIENRNVRIVNCTRGGHLEIFSRAKLEDIVGNNDNKD